MKYSLQFFSVSTIIKSTPWFTRHHFQQMSFIITDISFAKKEHLILCSRRHFIKNLSHPVKLVIIIIYLDFDIRFTCRFSISSINKFRSRSITHSLICFVRFFFECLFLSYNNDHKTWSKSWMFSWLYK
jgi:hypothetical protein